MKRFLGIFGKPSQTLLDQADGLVRMAYGEAVSKLGPMLGKYPVLQEVYASRASQPDYVEHFDFMMTIAGVFMALQALKAADIDADRRQEAVDRVEARLKEWNAEKAMAGLEHCQVAYAEELSELRKGGTDGLQSASDAIGTWIVADILQRFPETEEDQRLVRATGTMVTSKFSSYWKF